MYGLNVLWLEISWPKPDMAVLSRLGRSDWGKFSLRLNVSWAGSASFMDQ